MKRKVTPRAVAQVAMVREVPFQGAGIARAADGGRMNANHFGHGIDGKERPFHCLEPRPRHPIDTPHAPPYVGKVIATTRQHPAPEIANCRPHPRGTNAEVSCNCSGRDRVANDIYMAASFFMPPFY